MTDEQRLAFMEHMEAMIAEIEATGECTIPPFSFVTDEVADRIAQDLKGMGDG